MRTQLIVLGVLLFASAIICQEDLDNPKPEPQEDPKPKPAPEPAPKPEVLEVDQLKPSIKACPDPKPTANGEWSCTGNACHLSCDPGYAATGRTTTHRSSSDCSWILNPKKMSCSPAVALIIGGYSCVAKVSPSDFMVIGGHFNPAEVLQYNAMTGKIAKLANLGQARSGHGCVFVRHGSMVGVVVAGGHPLGKIGGTPHPRKTTNHAEFYSMDTGKWEAIGSLNEARRGIEMVFIDDTLYAMGGFNGKKYVSTVEKFNWATKKWIVVEDMLAARAFRGIVAEKEAVYQRK